MTKKNRKKSEKTLYSFSMLIVGIGANFLVVNVIYESKLKMSTLK